MRLLMTQSGGPLVTRVDKTLKNPVTNELSDPSSSSCFDRTMLCMCIKYQI